MGSVSQLDSVLLSTSASTEHVVRWRGETRLGQPAHAQRSSAQLSVTAGPQPP